MPVAITCPLCQRGFLVPTDKVNSGRPVACRGCRTVLLTTVVVRPAGEGETGPPAPPAPDPPAGSAAVSCPHCTRPVKIDPAARDKEVRCPYPNCKERFRTPGSAAADLLELLPPPAERRYHPWFEQGRSPGQRTASMSPEQIEVHRTDRKKLLAAWRDRDDPNAAFPFGAFEELKRQEQEARTVLVGLAREWQRTTADHAHAGADAGLLARAREGYAAAWRRHRHLARDVRTAVRYFRGAPPMTVPGLRWVFTDDDMRQVPEHLLPPTGAPEWDGYHLA